MRFSHSYFLLLLGLLPILHRFFFARQQPARIFFPVPIPKKFFSKNYLKFILSFYYIGLFFLIVALARPQTSFKQVERHLNGVDILLLLDVSASMNIEDLADRSRLEVAKNTIQTFVQGRWSDRIGLVAFSGEALTLAPLTLDAGLLLGTLKQTALGILKDGTAIGDGLALAVHHLKSSHAKSRIVILLTDGDNNIGQIDPMTAGELAAGYGIRVYTIVIGREGRVKIPVRERGLLGQVVTRYQWFNNVLNPKLLQSIAEKTHAKFYRVTDAKMLDEVFHEIDQLEKSDINVREKVRFDEQYQIPLCLGILFFLWGLFFEKILRRSLP